MGQVNQIRDLKQTSFENCSGQVSNELLMITWHLLLQRSVGVALQRGGVNQVALLFVKVLHEQVYVKMIMSLVLADAFASVFRSSF